MNKKALITGVTGMVGSHLADFLLENTDWDVYGVCRWRSPLDNVSHLLDRVNKKDRVFFEYADLNDEMSLITVVNKIMIKKASMHTQMNYQKSNSNKPPLQTISKC